MNSTDPTIVTLARTIAWLDMQAAGNNTYVRPAIVDSVLDQFHATGEDPTEIECPRVVDGRVIL